MVIYILLGLLAFLILAMIIYLARSNSIIQKEIQKQSDNRLNLLRNEINEREKNKNDVLLSEWQVSNEIEIRREAILVNGKQITEEIWSETNLLKDNFSFNPRDIKFIGKYIDLVVFDGVADETDVSIYFISIVKTKQNGQFLYKNKVKEAINNLKYNWKEINV
jgi:predicted Holliday junction resolvase-like endonuclease